MSGIDPQQLAQFAAALAFVLALVALVAWLARRFLPGAAGVQAGKKRRLAIVENLALDPKTRAVLLRRDDAEHLIVLGPNAATKIETIPAPAETPR
ncbi:MAG: flagellar biosynthetic protein FliO [Tagaea sp.]